MATMYALPSLTTWNSTAGGWSNTSGGASNGLVPQVNDKVIFDANSGVARNISITSTLNIGNMVCTGAQMTIAPAGGYAIVLNGTGVNDVFDLSGFVAIPTLQISSRWSGATLKTGSCSISTLTCTFGVDVKLVGDLTLNNALQIGDCAFYANGYNVRLATMQDVGNGGANPVVNFGSGTWTFTGTGTLMIYSYWVVQWSTATVKIDNTSAVSKTWNYAMTSSNKFWVANTGSAALISYAGLASSGSLGSVAVGLYRIDAGCRVVIPAGTYACANTWQVAGTSSSPVFLNSSVAGSVAYVYSGNQSTPFYFDYCNIGDVAVWGSPTFITRSSTLTGVASGWTVFKLRPNFLSFF